MTSKEFIEKSKNKFGNGKFGYEKIRKKRNLINPDTQITLFCMNHGYFNTTVEQHLNSTKFGGCCKCINESKNRSSKKSHIRTLNRINNELREMYNESKIGDFDEYFFTGHKDEFND